MKLNDFFETFKKKEEQLPMTGTDVAEISLPGDRPINEDSIGKKEFPGRSIFLLADGLGGHGKGEVASRIAVETGLELFNTTEAPNDILARIFETAQEKVLQEQVDSGNTNAMKTTLTAVILDGDKAYYGHIGDSRLYFFKNRKYSFRTLDHSVPQMLVSSGQMAEKEIRHHEDRNRLLRVIGTEWSEPRYELAKEPVTLHKEDALMLCSDGFWELVDEKQMTAALRHAENAQDWLLQMQRTVEKNGLSVGKNMDNYSSISIMVK